jgi:hypothetical protein
MRSNQIRGLMMVFVLLLGSSAASAAPVRGNLLARGLSQAWDLLGGALGWDLKHRCGIDPNGVWSCDPEPTTTDARCGIDPGAPCEPQPSQLKHGCGIDPNGVVWCVP